MGAVFVIRTEGGIVVERRADKGLLGGMLGLPHTEWQAESPPAQFVKQMFDLNFRPLGTYEHVFTHFALSQQVWETEVGSEQAKALLRSHNNWQLLPLTDQKALPTVFRKALKVL
jgi:A/G-specific adenine glycosylase